MRLAILLLLLSYSCAALAQNIDKDSRMKWWREARLGLFIHWGLYAIPAGKWGNRTDHGEWIRETAHIPVKEYEKLRGQFNPVKFNADQWVSMAKAAGMKYIVITSKHHDGFNLFASKYTDWDVMHTPFHRDVMKELSDACHKQGIQMCWYHSIMDWHHPDYLPRRGWEVKDRPVDGANMKRYVEYLHNEVSQLLTDYGPVGVMWFDGEWEPMWNDSYGRPLYELCRQIQPDVIVNNRVSNNRAGSMESAAPIGQQVGDFTTPEQYIPPTGLPGVDWETCMTMNDHWGYNAYDKDWKSSKELIQNIVDIASKGGNYLLNVGPMSDGEFPPEAVQRLKDIGAFMAVNGNAIYGTDASVFDALPWGRSTTKRDGDNTILYLHVFDWPADGKLTLPPMQNEVMSASLLGSGQSLAVERNGPDITIQLPATTPNSASSAVKLVVSGAPIVYKAPVIEGESRILVDREMVTITSRTPGLEIHYTTDSTPPIAASPIYTDPIEIRGSTIVRAAGFANGNRVTAMTTGTFLQVTPSPAVTASNTRQGLTCNEYKGDWDTMPDFSALRPVKTFAADSVSYPTKSGVAEERVGRMYAGFLQIPADGVYNFELTSDDGARLWIDNSLLVDNDGLHSAAMKSASAALAKGLHPIRIEWFNKTGDAALQLKWGRTSERLRDLSGGDVVHAQ